jgi:hypothetical protein
MKTKGDIVKFLLGNVSTLNVLLLIITVFFIFYVLLPRYRPDILSVSPVVKKPMTQEKSDVKPRMLSLSDFTIIGDKNLFHPERKIPVEIKSEGKPLPMPEPEYILHGTLVSDAVSIAYLEDSKEPRSTRGRGNRQITLHKGETLSGFTLKEIYTDKVVMVRGNETITVSISDSHKKIKTGQIAQKVPGTQAIGQSQPLQPQAKSPAQVTAQTSKSSPAAREKKIEPLRKRIDQDVFDFFDRRKQQ